MPNSSSRISCLLLAILFWSVSAAAEPVRPIYRDFSVAVPKEMPKEPPTLASPLVRSELLIHALLEIDKKGKVKKISAALVSDTVFLDMCGDYLRSIRFEPAQKNSKKVGSQLAIQVHLEPRRLLPSLEFPVGLDHSISNRRLYFESLELNGFVFPEIQFFPAYFCDLEWSDSTAILPYVLLRLNLDETGEVTEVEELNSSFSAFSGQLRSAVQYARFTPLTIDGIEVSSSCFLRVAFYPQINYPNREWTEENLAEFSFVEKTQLLLFPDTVGLLSLPLPSFNFGGRFPIPDRHTNRTDIITVYLTIDTIGVPFVLRLSKSTTRLIGATRRILSSMRFYPAIDYAGRPKEFSGLMRLHYEGSGNVRIEYLW